MARQSNNRKGNRSNKGRGKQTPKVVREEVKELTYHGPMTVAELADKINKNASDIIKLLFMMGTMVTINSTLDEENIELICMEFNIETTYEHIVEDSDFEEQLEHELEEEDENDLEERAPVVTIMGHVDHGKTTLLDNIRKANVTEGEFGGITQHIGAYQITTGGKKITFLDTPGHEAFTAMRARGAKVTDIVIIVVAADDGVMPQTKEAVDHAKAAGVPVIVAVNKIDKPDANVDKIMSEVSDLGLMPEEWGGDTIFAQISAKFGQGVPELLETVAVLSEVENLKANPNRLATGTVIEAKLDKGRGPVATLLVQNGTLKAGDPIVVGTAFGRVRKMTDDRGNEIQEALPSRPVEVIGLDSVPVAGDVFRAFDSDKAARSMASIRSDKRIDQERNNTSARSLDDLARQIEEGEVQDVNVIIKADVQGSAEAVAASMEKIDVDGVRVNVVRSTAGGVTESDVMLASASNAIIYGFNVRPNANVRKKAEEEKVEIRLHNIIYKALEEMELAMKGLLAPVYEEVVIGQAEVRETYKASKVGTIAGCMVTDGVIRRGCKVRLIRDDVVIYDGNLGSLRRFENDAKEVAAGYDCGLTIENFNDIKENDVIEAYIDQQVPIV